MIIRDISELLEKKLALFLEFEHYTELLTSCDIDSMPDYITKCSDLANEIEVVTGHITALCDTAKVVPSARVILSNQCDFSDVPPKWQPLFLQSQSILGAISRTIEINAQAVRRMRDLQAQLKDRIADTNNTSRIIKYISSSGVIQQERGISIRDQKI